MHYSPNESNKNLISWANKKKYIKTALISSLQLN